MTTLDTLPSVDDLLEDFRRSALQSRVRERLYWMPMVHLGVVSLFAVLCLNLVH